MKKASEIHTTSTDDFGMHRWSVITTSVNQAFPLNSASLLPSQTKHQTSNFKLSASTIHSHNKISTVNNNLSQYLHDKEGFTNYQTSRQRKHRSSHTQQQNGRQRSQNNLESSADKQNRAVVISADEARYNLATRIMSNGVEVIVAGDKTTLPGGHPNSHLRILTTTDAFKIPLTLAPSTLKDQMLLMLPHTTHGNSDNKYSSIKNTQVIYIFKGKISKKV